MSFRIPILTSSILLFALVLVGASATVADTSSRDRVSKAGGSEKVTASEDAKAPTGSFLDLEARRLGAGSEKLDRYRRQVLLVVNTASRCGNTP
jgi:hypothetical protein